MVFVCSGLLGIIQYKNGGIVTGITFNKQPNVIGFWRLYGGSESWTQFAMYSKPTDEQIKNTEELLGWVWVDKEES